ncbi:MULTISPECIES: TetR/AcrR family transcriptional regulator [Gordonia]|uniref:TetR/AcrR family transcriptional regulator n=1 Tax=Gordonia TaxID=2053 RepID=UPI001FCACCFB|nr:MULTISPECIES: TetR/AcrR family transcriptional regulator [Gordonia]MDF3280816.1 TetR/AcrR family transcriptional regulator [Gordonia sp. N1V]WCB40030.1 TetR/AcrR family transcriptional regulator [Gordonia polyisoprenivorans]
MANRPSPAAAARAAVSAATNVTRGIEQALLGGAVEERSKPDGRRQRWETHKRERRTELTDGTIAAVRELGADVGMDEIARHIGVSKTVLYRYFTDKNDLGVATTVRFFETTLMPRLIETITDDVDEYTLTRTVISVYVHAVADEPALYRFALSASPSSSVTSAESEKLVAQLLTSTIVMRLGERDGDAAGAQVWAYTLVGGIQRAVDWWMGERSIGVDDLIDYLTMMVWSSIVGVAAVNGSRTAFMADPPPLPEPAATEGDRDDHEPGSADDETPLR